MRVRTARDERRHGIHLIVFGAFMLAAMLAMWWLVATTNSEGDHDAELLPFFSLIPLLLGAFHLLRARARA